MTDAPTPRNSTLFWRGITRACGACGSRGLTRRWVTLREECPRCGFHFERKPGHFVGAVGMNTIATFGLILIVLIVGIGVMWPDVRAIPLLIAMLPIAVLGPLVIHPTAKTLWVAVDLMMNPLLPGESVIDSEERATQQG
jgi:uncharacterized protein (DUF983 family)